VLLTEVLSRDIDEKDRIIANGSQNGAYGYTDIKAKKLITPETPFEIGSVTKSLAMISRMPGQAGRRDCEIHAVCGMTVP
jgi:hypothetical protein